MNTPLIISAEAAVRSRRSGFISIFDPKAREIPGGLKPFYADPALIKKAVEKLKADGFSVTHAGKVTISISGTQALFERRFDVKIIETERGFTVADSNRIGFIDTKGSAYSELLAGVALEPKMKLKGMPEDPPEPDSGQIKPAELRRILKYDDAAGFIPASQGVAVMVIDSGYDPHPYIAKHHPQWENRISNLAGIEAFEELYEIREMLNSLGKMLETLSDHLGVLYEGYAYALETQYMDDEMLEEFNRTRDSIFRQLEEIVSAENLNELREADSIYFMDRFICEILESIEVKLKPLTDLVYHGTAVVIVLLELLTQQKGGIQVFGYDSSRRRIINGLKLLSEKNGKKFEELIVNCSYSFHSYVSKDGESATEPEDVIYPLYKKTFQTIADKGAIVVWSAGNKNQKFPTEKDVEPQWPFVISAGGAYQVAAERRNVVYLSEATHGYKSDIDDFDLKRVPDVCGHEGPAGKPSILLPNNRKTWEASSGSSFCAPQVSAACALIKAFLPSASLRDIREILIESSDEATMGGSSQGNPPEMLKEAVFEKGNVKSGVKAPGLLNFQAALELARTRNLQDIESLLLEIDAL